MRLWYFSSSVTHSSNAHSQPSSGARCLIFRRLFVYFHHWSVRTAKALARMRECADSPEPSLVTYVISTIISWAGSNIVVLARAFEKLFSKTKYSVNKALYRTLISTVSLQVTKKYANLSRYGVRIKRNAWDFSSIQHVTGFRIPEERSQLRRLVVIFF